MEEEQVVNKYVTHTPDQCVCCAELLLGHPDTRNSKKVGLMYHPVLQVDVEETLPHPTESKACLDCWFNEYDTGDCDCKVCVFEHALAAADNMRDQRKESGVATTYYRVEDLPPPPPEVRLQP